MLLTVLFPQLCYLLYTPYYGKMPYSVGLKCEVKVLCTNSYKELYDSTVLDFSVLCSVLSVFLSLSVLEAIFSELVIQLFLLGERDPLLQYQTLK